MTKKEFFCQDAAAKGRQAITKGYCLEECDALLRGLRSICPESIAGEITNEHVTKALEDSSETAKSAIKIYLDLLGMGGVEAAETQRPDLLQDVPEQEKELVGGGMSVLLSNYKRKKKSR